MSRMIGFVVLNYTNYEETINCVNSILAIDSPAESYYLVIVDNNSPNQSFSILNENYANIKNIKIIKSDKNGGYSSGNNIGIFYLNSINIFDIVIATSDTQIITSNIISEIHKIIQDENVGVIGPRIFDLQKNDQNPMLFKLNSKYILNIFFPNLMSFMRNYLKPLKNILNNTFANVNESQNKISSGYKKVYMVHGCFIVFTKNYFKLCGTLDENLFFYGEEDLIAYNCAINKLSIIYSPAIQIIHRDARSTPVEERRKFVNFHSRKAILYLQKKINILMLIKILIKKSKFY